MYQNNPTKCLTGEVRLSFVHLDQPYSNNGGEPKYSATLLVPKKDVATVEDLKNSLNTAYENGVKNLWKGSRPQMRYPVIYDGDGTARPVSRSARSARVTGLSLHPASRSRSACIFPTSTPTCCRPMSTPVCTPA